MSEFEVTRETYRSRVKRGWCTDRAAGVVPIPTYIKENDQVPVCDFLFLNKLIRIHNKSIHPMFMAWCACGEPVTVAERDLFTDLNCGCKKYGTTPEKLKLYAEIESNVEFIEYCKKTHKDIDVSNYRAFRHIKPCRNI